MVLGRIEPCRWHTGRVTMAAYLDIAVLVLAKGDIIGRQIGQGG